MKWNVYVYTYDPPKIRKVATVEMSSPIEALDLGRKKAKGRFDGIEVRRHDVPIDIAELVEMEAAKRRGEGRAWKSGGYGRPSKAARARRTSDASRNEDVEESRHRTPGSYREALNHEEAANASSSDWTPAY